LTAQLIEAEGGEQIVLLPPGFEFSADEIQLEKDGDRVIISPITPAESTDLES
jgi:virulence-associated protein VagC